MQALWMLFACLAFALMGACVKHASTFFNTFELVAYRGLISMLVMAAVARSRGIGLATPVPAMHAWRTLVGVSSLAAWFYAIAHLPLALAMTLNYMSSLWVAAFFVGGALMLRLQTAPEQPAAGVGRAATGPGDSAPGASAGASPQSNPQGNSGGWAEFGPVLGTIAVGFVGVLLILRPSIDQDQLFAGLVGLSSGLMAALAYMQVTALGRVGEPEVRTVFYFAAGCALVGVLALPIAGVSPWPGWQNALWLLPMGILASIGQWGMTRAYAKGATLVVANLQYSGVVFATLLGWLIFGEQVSFLAWAGISLIIGSGVIATVLRERRQGGTASTTTD